MRATFGLTLLALAAVGGAAPAQADFLVGVVAYDRGDYATALAAFTDPETSHAPEAKDYLGRMYLFGQGVTADPALGAALLEQAAAGGVLDAVVTLAQLYDRGMGVAKDTAKALAYWQQAAELGLVRAQVELGQRYESGAATGEPDYATAADYYRQAAAQGDLGGMTQLGQLYQKGLGVEIDLAEAERLYRKAATKGSALAMNHLARLLVTTGGDLAEARELAEVAVAREGQPAFHDTLGTILQQQGDFAGAEAEFREAMKKSPFYAAAREHLGDLYWQQGRRLEAKTFWQEAHERALNPQDKARIEEKLERITF